MMSTFSTNKTDQELYLEEREPILHGRTKQIRPPHIVFRLFYGLLTVAVCTLVVLTTVHLATSSSKSEANNSVDEVNVVNNNEGRLGQSNNGGNNANKNGQTSKNPVVRTSNGEIRGTVKQSRDGRDYFAFYDIPYAEPPVGQLRFQPPKPFKTKWRGVRDGTNTGGEDAQCMQSQHDTVSGTEDCLKLQVFTPKLPGRFGRRNPKLPVMFYILGGAYKFGRANRYGADYMMDEDVILVLIDFRYGAFGHLNTEDSEIRGNMGFKDQVMALRWVQENIKKFGGDPKKVLIFGNSSGASSVHSHIISSMSDGLFSRAVSQSGTIALPPEFVTKPIDSARFLGAQLNCTNIDDTRELRLCLEEADANDIAAIKLSDMHYLTKEALPADGDSSQVFMTDMPINLLKEGKFKKDIPWILGANSAESYAMANTIIQTPSGLELVDKYWNDLAPTQFGFEDDNITHVGSKEIRQFYFGSKPIDKEARINLTNILSDIKWLHPIKVAADYHAKYGALGYFYLLTHEPIQSYGESSKAGLPPPYGVSHADEVQLLFPFEDGSFPYISSESRDYSFSKTIIKVWTDFARTGVPSVPGLKEWPPLPVDPKDVSTAKWLEFNDTSRLMEPLTERMTFLDSFPYFITPELYGAEEPNDMVIDSLPDLNPNNFIY